MSKKAFSVSPSSIEKVKQIGCVTRSRSRRTNRFDMIPLGVNVALSSSMCSARARTEVKLATAFPLLAAATTPRAADPPTGTGGEVPDCHAAPSTHKRPPCRYGWTFEQPSYQSFQPVRSFLFPEGPHARSHINPDLLRAALGSGG